MKYIYGMLGSRLVWLGIAAVHGDNDKEFSVRSEYTQAGYFGVYLTSVWNDRALIRSPRG